MSTQRQLKFSKLKTQPKAVSGFVISPSGTILSVALMLKKTEFRKKPSQHTKPSFRSPIHQVFETKLR